VSYQEPKNRDYGVNLCKSCLEKQRQIDRLKEENQRLRQKLNLNERKLQQGFFGSSTSSAKVPLKKNSLLEKQARQGGGQVGHRGVGRKTFSPGQADERRIVRVEAGICETCCCALQQQSVRERAVYELEREEVRQVYYQIERKKCPQCRKIISGKVENAFPRVSLSNELVVEVAEQHYLLGRSLGQISQHLKLSEATVFENLKRIAKKLKPGLEELKKIYRNSLVRQADETGWRTNGGNGYAWYFGSSEVSLYLFRQTRSAGLVREVFGKEQLSGVLVVDQSAGYNQVGSRIQYCYAHLLRKQEDLAKAFPKSREVRNYTSPMIKLLSQAMKLRKQGLSEKQYQKEAGKIKRKILNLSGRQAKHPAGKSWQDFYLEKSERLYQWCESEKIPAENNYAEREIRKIVIAGKNSYGSQSDEGAEMREIGTSILASLQKREANPREKLVEGLNRLSADENFDLAGFFFGESESQPD
jgi:transposase-like protein